MKFFKFGSVLLGLLLFVVPAVGAAAAEDEDCYQLLENHCQSCHMLGRVCKKLDKKSERAWKSTIVRMVKRRGAEVDAQQQAVIVKCLVSRDASLVQGCEQ